MDIAEILLDNGAKISLTLPYVASSRKLELIDFLLKCNAYIVDVYDETFTPLHLAVKNALTINTLFERFSDVQSKNPCVKKEADQLFISCF